MSYSSQYGEHAKVLELFPQGGRFLDVGAGDGLTWSNTAPLLHAQGHWTGVMVEPSLGQLQWLVDNWGRDERVQIIPGLVIPESMGVQRWVHFFDGRDYSTVLSSHRDKITEHSQGDIKFRQRLVPSITWKELLRAYPGPYDFLNIDVEGMNDVVLDEAPLDQFACVCVEIDPPERLEWMRGVLMAGGLINSEVIGGNLLGYR